MALVSIAEMGFDVDLIQYLKNSEYFVEVFEALIHCYLLLHVNPRLFLVLQLVQELKYSSQFLTLRLLFLTIF